MNKKRVLHFFSLMLIFTPLAAQVGGESGYNFLNFPFSSRVAALGGGLISAHDSDAELLTNNPSLISSRHHKQLLLHFTDYFADAHYGEALYAHTFKKAGSLAFAMRYAGYGKFTGTDAAGLETGEFTAGDYAATVGWGRPLGKGFSIGARLTLALSSYEHFTAFGFGVDVGGSYYNEKKKLSLSLVFKNIGSEIDAFTPEYRQKMPFDLQFALSQRFAHIPVRYHLSAHHLYRWDLIRMESFDPFHDRDAVTGEIRYPSKAARFADNLFRHLIFGIEIEPSRYFSLLLAYNHQRNREMRIPQGKSMAGFSYGFMLHIHAFRIGFSRAHYAAGAVPNYFTFALSFDELAKRSNENKKKKLERVN